MSAVQRFKFDQSFDKALREEEAAAPAVPEADAPAEPTFTQAELKAAEESAHASGYAKGAEEARAAAQAEFENSGAQTLTAALEKIAEYLAEIAAAQAALRDRFEHDAIKVACAIAKKTTPRLLSHAAIEMVDAVVAEVLPRLLDEPRIAVRVADQVLDGLTARLDEQKAKSGFEGEFIVVADPELAAADCRIEWADGGVDVSAGRVWSEIDAVVDEFLGAVRVTPSNPEAPQDSPDGPATAVEQTAAPVEDTKHEA